ncbi:MAG: hypothetical protein ABSE18_00260 [Minisyncoccia bacterium]|jgi:hypothetical protein
MASFEMKWEAPEYEYREKGVSWYWISIIIAAVIIAFSVWERNFLFGLFVVIAEMLFIVWGNRAPRTVRFALTENGVAIEGGKSHSLKDFESVSATAANDGWVELTFTFRAKLKTPLKIFLPEARLTEFRNNMKLILREVPHEPTLLDSIEKLVGF